VFVATTENSISLICGKGSGAHTDTKKIATDLHPKDQVESRAHEGPRIEGAKALSFSRVASLAWTSASPVLSRAAKLALE